MPDFQKSILLTCCSDANITAGSSKRIDPMLKLYTGRPLIINGNINVENKIANGSMVTFRNVKLKMELNIFHSILRFDLFYQPI